MISMKLFRAIVAAFICAGALVVAPAVFGQEPAQSTSQTRQAQRDDDTNLDTQLYLILATNRDIDEGKMPAALDPIIKRLRESLPFKHYSLAGTFLNRVKNFGRLEVSWIGGPFVNASAPLGNPSFNQFATTVTLATDNEGKQVVRLRDFRFGAKVPIVVGSVGNTTNASTAERPVPVINYESIGLHTDLSIREGTPAIAGTLHVGPSGDAIVVAISARRAD
ncbi:MAG TPA: hypothetical protein VFU37_23120 [Pyrinomonadaceae bacterium]|nr:hypothetical protein [Pyrinomonadaceae bacterium]